MRALQEKLESTGEAITSLTKKYLAAEQREQSLLAELKGAKDKVQALARHTYTHKHTHFPIIRNTTTLTHTHTHPPGTPAITHASMLCTHATTRTRTLLLHINTHTHPSQLPTTQQGPSRAMPTLRCILSLSFVPFAVSPLPYLVFCVDLTTFLRPTNVTVHVSGPGASSSESRRCTEACPRL